MMIILFLGAIVLTIYAYFGYPISLIIIKAISGKDIKKNALYPKISMIITVHNEEKRISEKLKNTLSLDYPRENIQIIVASDGSNDGTNQIVLDHEKYGVVLHAIPKRQGKESAQKEAVAIAKGEIFVFSDVATILPPDSIREIISNFADPTVGAVSGEDRLIRKADGGTGEGMYVKYEMWLRKLESSVNSLVGLSGSFFAARRDVCSDFSEEMQSDFRTVLNCMRLGYRAVSDPLAIGYYEDISDKTREFERKVRTVVRGLTVFFRNTEFLNPIRYGIFSYQYFCHKLLRWLVPLFLLVAFGTNIILAFKSDLLLALLLCQILFYLIGVPGLLRNKVSLSRIERVSAYFTTVNMAIIKAWYKYLRGERIILWTPSKR